MPERKPTPDEHVVRTQIETDQLRDLVKWLQSHTKDRPEALALLTITYVAIGESLGYERAHLADQVREMVLSVNIPKVAIH